MEVLLTCALSRVGFPKQRETVGPGWEDWLFFWASSAFRALSSVAACFLNYTARSLKNNTVCYHNAPDGTAAVRQPNLIKGAHVILKVEIKTWLFLGYQNKIPDVTGFVEMKTFICVTLGFCKNDYVECEVDMGHKMYQMTIYLLFKYADRVLKVLWLLQIKILKKGKSLITNKLKNCM